MSDEHDGIDDFAQALSRVRDQAVHDADLFLDPRFKRDVPGLRIRAAIQDGVSGEELIKLSIPEIVDVVIWRILENIRPDSLDITYRTPSGEVVDLSRDWAGELAGQYLVEWRPVFLTSRYTPY